MPQDVSIEVQKAYLKLLAETGNDKEAVLEVIAALRSAYKITLDELGG